MDLAKICISKMVYSKNPHKRTNGLKTLRLKFAQKDTIIT